jgi:hypothetical protein
VKALTLTQPWATLVALGIKRVETRSWSTAYRGPLLIHAAKGWTRDDRDVASVLQREGVLPVRPGSTAWALQPYALGAIIARCRLVDVVPTAALWEELSPLERELGDYRERRYAWRLADVEQLPRPIPWRGALGLWNGPDL